MRGDWLPVSSLCVCSQSLVRRGSRVVVQTKMCERETCTSEVTRALYPWNDHCSSRVCSDMSAGAVDFRSEDRWRNKGPRGQVSSRAGALTTAERGAQNLTFGGSGSGVGHNPSTTLSSVAPPRWGARFATRSPVVGLLSQIHISTKANGESPSSANNAALAKKPGISNSACLLPDSAVVPKLRRKRRSAASG